ncbi:ImmA/IrrE family metallo-endopeptidase [Croceicoccus marinus]|uniref:ImmA/IrrE family metallo-endopeptidase n=1 Tax=Croceicoccus marinus TaxID=450378 RepID=A0A7G6VU25_9SPHN|nr:XRE family transcriptional regulator [Croceicoccus marinus]QNE05240.1 ImmA/IrrE family metallo-endopeptidase [Croceicoccus marinus]
MPVVKPSILRWARESAGLSLEEAAAKVGIRDARGVPGEDRLLALETEEGEVSRPVLLKMAKVYRRPLVSFYLEEPPVRGDRGEDFRTLPDQHTAGEPLVDALVRDIRSRQAMVRAVLVEEEEAQPLAFVSSMSRNDGVGPVLASIRKTLGLDLAAFRAQGSAEAAFSMLRRQVEMAGVYVLLIGNLGSHHSAIDVDAFRGFALADPIAPFVVINDQDAKTAWSFTLLHEVAHLWIGATGVSGGHIEGATEQFCNDVASSFLLPEGELNQLRVQLGDEAQIARQITEFANERLVSRSLVAYRLFRAGALDQAAWRNLTETFKGEWLRNRAAQRERARAQDGGPNYYIIRRHRLGSALLSFVARNMSEGVLTPTRAGKLLGVKPRSVHPLLSGASLSVEQGA